MSHPPVITRQKAKASVARFLSASATLSGYAEQDKDRATEALRCLNEAKDLCLENSVYVVADHQNNENQENQSAAPAAQEGGDDDDDDLADRPNVSRIDRKVLAKIQAEARQKRTDLGMAQFRQAASIWPEDKERSLASIPFYYYQEAQAYLSMKSLPWPRPSRSAMKIVSPQRTMRRSRSAMKSSCRVQGEGGAALQGRGAQNQGRMATRHSSRQCIYAIQHVVE